MARLHPDDKEELLNEFKTVIARLDRLEQRMDRMEADVKQIAITQAIETARAANARAGMSDMLVQVPLPSGNLPTGAFPTTLGILVVGGSELQVGYSQVSEWSREKSIDLIQQYDSGYLTEVEDSGRNKEARSSRRRRLHLAKLLGVTPGQMALVAQASFLSPPDSSAAGGVGS